MGVRRAGLLVSDREMHPGQLHRDAPIGALGEGTREVQRDVLPAPQRTLSACDRCRAGMSTSPLLTKLRCAECRQITLTQLYDLGFKASLVAIGGLIGWFAARPTKGHDKA